MYTCTLLPESSARETSLYAHIFRNLTGVVLGTCPTIALYFVAYHLAIAMIFTFVCACFCFWISTY